MLTNTYFYCPSHSYPFEAINFWAMFHLVFLIQLYHKISLAKDMWKACFWKWCSNNILDLQAGVFSKIQKSPNKDPIVKLGSLGHNLLEYCANLSMPWPWTIIPVNILGNCSSPQIILFATCNLGNVVFTWSILSWITQKNSSLECTYLDLQVWYKLLHNSWCKRCFLNFSSYSFASLLFFPNFDIKSFSDSHTIHFVNTKPLFLTSTLRWCLFLNLFIVNCKIPPMFNSLLICENVIQKQWSN